MVIGTTGFGKTATFVNPSIQILSELKSHPLILISDPKGELYQSNAKALRNKGYEVKALDLKNPHNSVRWNPLERPYLLHQRAMGLEKEIARTRSRVATSSKTISIGPKKKWTAPSR